MGDTPVFEPWEGQDGRAWPQLDKRKKCGGPRVKSKNEAGGEREHGRDSARFLGWKSSVG